MELVEIGFKNYFEVPFRGPEKKNFGYFSENEF